MTLVKKTSILIILFIAFTISKANLIPITPLSQFTDNTCWAASCAMVLDYYYYPQTHFQTDMRTYAVNGADLGLPFIADAPDHSCQDVLVHYGPVSSQYDGANLTFNAMKTEFDVWRPIMVGWEIPDEDLDHVVLAIGYNSTSVIYNNPSNSYGSPYTTVYSQFVDDGVHTWIETLKMTTTAPNIGVNDYVFIYSGPSSFSYPGSSSTYQCEFRSNEIPPAHATSFTWSMYFNYWGGTYTVASGTVSGYDYSSWNVSSFNLPSGYSWSRNDNGVVIGQVTVSTMDSDGYTHSDFKNITYAEQYPYPNYVYFNNQTISTAHSDVKAHYVTSLTNDVVTSTGTISLKGGTGVNIHNGVTVYNGSAVNFVVDPTLQ